MQARWSKRHTTLPGRAAIPAAAALAFGCAQEPAPREPVDAAIPSDFAVRGTATGVLGPVALELRIDGGAEPLAVTQEGAFAFETRLEAGASYTVALVDPGTPCTLRNQTGVIAGAVEDGAAQSVGGNPDDDSTASSGAIYVFH